MTDTTPVDVIVKIKDRTTAKLKNIERKIEKLQGNIGLFVVVADGELDDALLKKLALEKNTTSTHTQKIREVRIPDHSSGIISSQRSQQINKRLADMRSIRDLKLPDYSTAFLSGTRGGQIDQFFRDSKRLPKKDLRDAAGLPDTEFRPGRKVGGKATRAQMMDRFIYSYNRSKMDKENFELGLPSIGLPEHTKRRKNAGSRRRTIGRAMYGIHSFSDKIGSAFNKVKPTMYRWMNLIAALLPSLIVMGGHLLGIAAAMGSVALAGGAIVGMGLLGMGDSLAESARLSRERIDELKNSLFDVLQPTASTFTPIMDRLFDQLPGDLSTIMPSIGGLDVFEDTVSSSMRGLIEWTGEFITAMVSLEPIISQLSERFGALFGRGLIDMFRWLTTETGRNQELFMDLGAVLINIGETIWNLSIGVSKVVADLRPLFAIISMISKVLKHDFIVGLIETIALTYAVSRAITAATVAWKALTLAISTNPLGLLAVGASLLAYKTILEPGLAPTAGPQPSPVGGGSGGNTFIYNDHGGNQIEDFREIAEGTYTDMTVSAEYTTR